MQQAVQSLGLEAIFGAPSRKSRSRKHMRQRKKKVGQRSFGFFQGQVYVPYIHLYVTAIHTPAHFLRIRVASPVTRRLFARRVS